MNYLFIPVHNITSTLTTNDNNISLSAYRVFVDNQWHGEVKANAASNKSGYQYYLSDLNCGQSYDISVRVRLSFNIIDIHQSISVA
jgi:hypothetical protein